MRAFIGLGILALVGCDEGNTYLPEAQLQRSAQLELDGGAWVGLQSVRVVAVDGTAVCEDEWEVIGIEVDGDYPGASVLDLQLERTLTTVPERSCSANQRATEVSTSTAWLAWSPLTDGKDLNRGTVYLRGEQGPWDEQAIGVRQGDQFGWARSLPLSAALDAYPTWDVPDDVYNLGHAGEEPVIAD